MDLGQASKAVEAWIFTYTLFSIKPVNGEHIQNTAFILDEQLVGRGLTLTVRRIDVGETLKPLIVVVFLSVCQLAQPPSSNR